MTKIIRRETVAALTVDFQREWRGWRSFTHRVELLPRVALYHEGMLGDHSIARRGGRWTESWRLHVEWLGLVWGVALRMKKEWVI